MHISGAEITIYGQYSKPVPVVYIHTFDHEGSRIWSECQRIAAPQFYLVCIDGCRWNTDLSPWQCDNLTPGAQPLEAGAKNWLEIFCDQIVPSVEQSIQVSKRIIAGYSLAGLFAFWSVSNANIFDACIACSASFWVPGFMQFAEHAQISENVKTFYFSIGDKESKVKNTLMQQTEPNTRQVHNLLKSKGFDSIFELNNGNHFQQTDWRVAKAIKQTLASLKKHSTPEKC